MNSERQTRQEKIDLQLGCAGWAVGSRRLVEEFLVDKASLVGDPKSTYPSNNEFADYALLDRFDRSLAIVEAKRSSRNPLEGERQAADYADALRAKHGVDPFVFPTAMKFGFGIAISTHPEKLVDSSPKKTCCGLPTCTSLASRSPAP